jgi:hypothetical protein
MSTAAALHRYQFAPVMRWNRRSRDHASHHQRK